ncbi:DUF819 family protein [Kangiella sediminilitoris]|uniref:Putative ATP synthase F0, A subunit n=1 Tax=Kangiella sediminilitoris TaxID=1144748 RepID=A0A1B3B8W7_9GAMM|nr:DUF819 family protein [Kangiella sediminilitoris]AOE49220.1 Putative ATP synthase F0, A subunit [Kangiella sediminilitoris]
MQNPDTTENVALIQSDAVAFGVIMAVLGLIFYTSSRQHGFWHKFYKHIPALLLCYFVPGALNTFGIFEVESAKNIYHIASRYLLPASLFLLTLSIDLKKIFGLGWRALAMFFTATVGIIIGGPLAIWLFHVISPEWVAGDIWKGMSTVAGSWIGGGANQASMQALYNVNDTLFGTMAVVDVLVAEIWMIGLLIMAKKSDSLDKKLGADNSSIEDLKHTVEKYTRENERVSHLNDYMIILGVAFGVVALGHAIGGWLSPFFGQFEWAKEYSLDSNFLWLILTATFAGIGLSFTRTREYEHAGASKIGSVFIYVLVASIGMKMDLFKIFEEWQLFLVGAVWMMIHIILLFIVAKAIKAPAFFIAVGSKANVGGAASAPVVAAAFHPSLAPVGVLLAILGYAVGTFGAYLTAEMMRMIVTG